MKKLRRFVSLLLAAAMVLAMSGAALAAVQSDSKGKITVNKLEAGDKVEAYQIITVNVDGNGNVMDPEYTWVEGVANWLANQSQYGKYIKPADKSVTDEFIAKEGGDEVYKSFFHDLAAAIKRGDIQDVTVTKEATANADGTAILEQLNMGEYLLIASGDSNKVYSPAAGILVPKWDETSNAWILADSTADMKGETPTIDKDIPEVGDRTAGVGDTVEYKLKVKVPEYPSGVTRKEFKVGDLMSKGLTFKSDVTIYNETDQAEVANSNDNYEVKLNEQRPGSTTATDKLTFLIEFTKTFIENNANDTLTITYTATVNEGAIDGTSVNQDNLKNTATMFYHDPYDTTGWKTDDDNEKVFSYEINVNKVGDNNTPLAGAVFKLTEGQKTIEFVNLDNGVYRVAKDDDTIKVREVTTAEGGILKLIGLDTGTYTLTETKAPADYNLPSNADITITLEDKDLDGKPNGTLDNTSGATATGNILKADSVLVGNSSNNRIDFTVVNHKGFSLPSTGGMGTIVFAVGGILLMGAAVVLMVTLSRRNA